MKKHSLENELATPVVKVTRYQAPAVVDGEIVYLCSLPVCCKNVTRLIILGAAVGVLAFSSVTLPFASLDNNEHAGASDGGITSELRDLYSDTTAVIRYLIACACIAILFQAAAFVAQILIRYNQLKEQILPFNIADIIASGVLVLMYVAGGIAIAYYASVWDEPPDGCDALRDLEIQDPCSSVILTTFGSILTALSFGSAISLLAQGIWATLSVINKWDNY